MHCYKYDIDGRFTGVAEVMLSPVDELPMLPFGSTLIAPPEAIEGHYVAFADGEWVQIEVVVQIEPFDDLKQRKKQEISAGFDNTLVSKLTSYTTIGLANNITINARERDLYNVEQLHSHMVDHSAPSTNFRCFDNSFVLVTVADIAQIEKELRAFGLFLYQQKWLMEALIDSLVEDTPLNRLAIEGVLWAH